MTCHRAFIAPLFGLALFATPALAQQGVPGAHFIENWDGNGDGTVTPEEIRERRALVFEMFDANADGLLDAEEYTLFDETRARDIAGQQGQGQGQGQGHGMNAMVRAADGLKMDATDLDGNGSVTKDEFLESSESWFTALDRNGDGAITTDDFGR